MVYQQLGVYAEKPVQQVFVIIFRRFSERAPRDIAHCIKSVCDKPFRYAASDPPKVGQRLMCPELLPIAHFIKIRYPDAVFIGRHMLCDDVHCYLAQVQICSDTCGRGYPGGTQHVFDHSHGKFVRREL